MLVVLQLKKSNPCSGGRVFPLSVFEWSFTICPTQYSRNEKALPVSLKENISFLLSFEMVVAI